MNAVLSAPAVLETDAGDVLQKDVDDVITTIEHLAVRAAHAHEPCAQILFRTAELLRLAILKR